MMIERSLGSDDDKDGGKVIDYTGKEKVHISSTIKLIVLLCIRNCVKTIFHCMECL